MIQNTIAKIEAQIESSASLTPERRKELTDLLEELKAEVNQLTDDAVPLEKSAKTTESPELLQHSIDELTEVAAKFEKSHPRLFQAAQSITNTLSNIGI